MSPGSPEQQLPEPSRCWAPTLVGLSPSARGVLGWGGPGWAVPAPCLSRCLWHPWEGALPSRHPWVLPCCEPQVSDTSRALARWEHLPEKPLARVVPDGSPCRGHSSAGAFLPRGRNRGYFSTLPKLSGCCRGPLRVPFVTLSQALLCQHGVGKWLCLTRTCWVCDLAALVVASASPKQLPRSPLPGAALPSPAALAGRRGGAGHGGVSPAPLELWWLGGQRMGHLLLPHQHPPSASSCAL